MLGANDFKQDSAWAGRRLCKRATARHLGAPYGRWCAALRRLLRTSVYAITARHAAATARRTQLPMASPANTAAPPPTPVPIPVPYILFPLSKG